MPLKFLIKVRITAGNYVTLLRVQSIKFWSHLNEIKKMAYQLIFDASKIEYPEKA